MLQILGKKKEITIIGDQTGTWETDNSAGIYIGWSQGSGPTYHTTTLDAYRGSFVMVKSDQTNLTTTNAVQLGNLLEFSLSLAKKLRILSIEVTQTN